MSEKIIILDFGSQVTQLIARRVRELNIYCEIHPFNKIPVIDESVKGIILSGSPCSVRDEDSPRVDLSLFRGKLPVLGICYGAQLMAFLGGGEVYNSGHREYGRAKLAVGGTQSPIFKDVSLGTQVWMSHGDTIMSLPANFEVIGSTDDVKYAAFHIKDEPTYGIQFHPEVTHSLEGKTMLKNFVIDICKCSQDWTADSFVDSTVAALKAQLGDDKEFWVYREALIARWQQC